MTAPAPPASGRPRILLSWSSGKDAAYALHRLRADGTVDVVGLLTTVTEPFARVAMHGVREALLDRQAEAVGLPVLRVPLPSPCSNAEYEARMGAALARARADGVAAIAFGDLFLEDVRAYREARMAATGIACRFPLWGEPTDRLAREMIARGVRARVVCVDPAKLDPSFAGRPFDRAFLEDLPASVDPCGERGEFHTFAWDGPAFRHPVPVRPGPVVRRDGFVFADLLPDDGGGPAGPAPGEDATRR
ncbi:MAG TPA: ATP-binding protein [Thermoplasmata archaeon]|nr:ATP-binding protein [Thermoplasmata archaeon]